MSAEQECVTASPDHFCALFQTVSDFACDMGVPEGRIRDAVSSMGETLRKEMSDGLRADFETRFRESMETAARQFNERFQETVAKFEADRDELYREVSEARKRNSQITAELIAAQAQLDHLNRETAAMLEAPDSELAKIMRHKSQIIELSSYIKGLQYVSAPPIT